MFYEAFVRTVLHITKPINSHLTVKAARFSQNALLAPMLRAFKAHPTFTVKQLKSSSLVIADSAGTMEKPYIALYIHGGAYTAGGMGYVEGVAGTLTCKLGITVAGSVYRLAPENPFPCALYDAYESYCFLISSGYSPENIVLIGESAGGGLVFALCDMLKEKRLKQPRCAVVMSPWTDLTFSGESLKTNKHKDPSISEKYLRHAAKLYTNGVSPSDPHISTIFADSTGFPKTLIFVGSDEILLSDAENMRANLSSHGVENELLIGERMWHAYPLFNTRYDSEIFTKIKAFIEL